ncbi:MAG TPA: hypothetical protein VME43_22095 [Bryobacteraceae bacterium]|nr:hypothetical protein [Bryobacteraceae bacterium]
MDIGKELLLREAAAAGIPAEQAALLWTRLDAATEGQSKFDSLSVAYYFGGLIIIGAMTFFFTLAWDRVGGAGILALALAYGCVFGGLGGYLFHARKLRVAGGLLTTAAVCMMPLAIYGLERLLKLPAQGSGSYLDEAVRENRVYMEIASIAAGAVALRLVRFPFLTAPMAFALWMLSMDLAPQLFGWNETTSSHGLWISAAFGLAMLLAAYGIDRRTRDDYAFWLYLSGVMALWCGLTFQEDGSPWEWFAYCLVNIALLAVSTFLDRRVFAVFGSLGVAIYLGYLASSLFRDSLLLPVALTGIGLAVIAAAVGYQKNRAKVDALVIGSLPAGLRRLSPAARK